MRSSRPSFYHIISLTLSLIALVWSLWLAFGPRPARAHSFYPWECCSDRDCWPTGADRDAREPDPVPTGGGWRLFDGTVIPYANARPSPDGRFHVCREKGLPNGRLIVPNAIPGKPAKPPCLWAPVQGM